MMDHTMTKNPDSIPYNIWPAEALRLAEREAADSLGLTLFELMQRAGEAAFQLASCAYPASAHWLILCGHGNNGGDGYVVARLAQAAARRVTLLAVGGIVYSLGVIFYVCKRIPYNHAIWHGFVLGGSVCHFLAIYLYVGQV